MIKDKKDDLQDALPKKKLIVNLVLLVAGMVLVSLFFYYEDLILSAEHQSMVSVVCLFGWSFFCCSALVRACLGLMGSMRSAWRDGKWSEYGLTIVVWVAAVAFVWFVMDIPGLFGRLMGVCLGNGA